MKAFWWFKKNAIAGMARPGFNKTHWFDLPYEQGVVLGWLGQFSSGTAPVEDFHRHLDSYCPKIFKFYNLTEAQNREVVTHLKTAEGLHEAAKKLAASTDHIDHLEMHGESIEILFCDRHLRDEVQFLKDQKISRLITLTEKHHNREDLQTHFDLVHFSIPDLTAPTIEQVLKMAEILRVSQKEKATLGVHCLAGIGRTSTMIIAAHMAMGEKKEDLIQQVSKQNPPFKFTGQQAEFINSLSSKLANLN